MTGHETMLVGMNAIYEHPSLKMQVTPEQRDRAESWLKDAYADGRISESEFDRRIGQVLTADTRKELNEAFYGLVQIPTPSRALGAHPAYQPLVRPETVNRPGRGAAGSGPLLGVLPLALRPRPGLRPVDTRHVRT